MSNFVSFSEDMVPQNPPKPTMENPINLAVLMVPEVSLIDLDTPTLVAQRIPEPPKTYSEWKKVNAIKIRSPPPASQQPPHSTVTTTATTVTNPIRKQVTFDPQPKPIILNEANVPVAQEQPINVNVLAAKPTPKMCSELELSVLEELRPNLNSTPQTMLERFNDHPKPAIQPIVTNMGPYAKFANSQRSNIDGRQMFQNNQLPINSGQCPDNYANILNSNNNNAQINQQTLNEMMKMLVLQKNQQLINNYQQPITKTMQIMNQFKQTIKNEQQPDQIQPTYQSPANQQIMIHNKPPIDAEPTISDLYRLLLQLQQQQQQPQPPQQQPQQQQPQQQQPQKFQPQAVMEPTLIQHEIAYTRTTKEKQELEPSLSDLFKIIMNQQQQIMTLQQQVERLMLTNNNKENVKPNYQHQHQHNNQQATPPIPHNKQQNEQFILQQSENNNQMMPEIIDLVDDEETSDDLALGAEACTIKETNGPPYGDWKFYDNTLEQVIDVLQNSPTNNQPARLKNKNLQQVFQVSRVQGMQFNDVNVSSTQRVTFETAAHLTQQQLQPQTQNGRQQNPPAMPKITDRSIAMNSLALKYLSGDKLNVLLNQSNQTGEFAFREQFQITDTVQQPSHQPNVIQNTNIRKNPTDMSTTTFNYMTKYGLLQNKRFVPDNN